MLAAIPEGQVRWTDPKMRGAWLAIAGAALVALVFLPRSLTNNDEYYYAGQAYTLAQGRLTPHIGDPLPLPDEKPAQAFRYPVAWPAILAPARVLSIRAMYVVALLVHLLGAAAVARMLVRREVRSELTVAYLFHPVLWIYSRTLLSDVPATAALLLAMDAWENRSRATAAGALGFSSAVRLANVTTVFGFGLSVLGGVRRRFADVVSLTIGVATFWAVQLAVNRTLGGYWLFSTYAQQGATMFTGGMALENAGLYLAGLALLPPFPLIVAALRPRKVERWAVLALVVVAAYVPIAFHNVSPNIMETLVGGQRYVIPAHAALLVATARIWSTPAIFRRSWLPIAMGIVVGVAGCLAMKRLERRHGMAAEAVAACRPDRLGYNFFANRVAGSVEARSYHLSSGSPDEAAQWEVLVLAPGYQSNQPGFSSAWASGPPRIPGATCRQVGAYAIYDFSGRCPPHGEPCRFGPPVTK